MSVCRRPGTALGPWEAINRQGFPGAEEQPLGRSCAPEALSLPPCDSSSVPTVPDHLEAGILLTMLPPARHDLILIWTTPAVPSLRGAEDDAMATASLLGGPGLLPGMPDQASPLSGDGAWGPTLQGQNPVREENQFEPCWECVLALRCL